MSSLVCIPYSEHGALHRKLHEKGFKAWDGHYVLTQDLFNFLCDEMCIYSPHHVTRCESWNCKERTIEDIAVVFDKQALKHGFCVHTGDIDKQLAQCIRNYSKIDIVERFKEEIAEHVATTKALVDKVQALEERVKALEETPKSKAAHKYDWGDSGMSKDVEKMDGWR